MLMQPWKRIREPAPQEEALRTRQYLSIFPVVLHDCSQTCRTRHCNLACGTCPRRPRAVPTAVKHGPELPRSFPRPLPTRHIRAKQLTLHEKLSDALLLGRQKVDTPALSLRERGPPGQDCSPTTGDPPPRRRKGPPGGKNSHFCGRASPTPALVRLLPPTPSIFLPPNFPAPSFWWHPHILGRQPAASPTYRFSQLRAAPALLALARIHGPAWRRTCRGFWLVPRRSAGMEIDAAIAKKAPAFHRGSICAQVPRNGFELDTRQSVPREYVAGRIIPIARAVSPKGNARGRARSDQPICPGDVDQDRRRCRHEADQEPPGSPRHQPL
jgi:hypothetical protein